MVIFLLLMLLGFVEAADECKTDDIDVKIKNSHVRWIDSDKSDAKVGVLRCDDGYTLIVGDGMYDAVFCKDGKWEYSPGVKCENDAEEEDLEFGGLNYKFVKLNLPMKKTAQHSLADSNLTYTFVADYTATKKNPTVRVKLGLIGKPKNPVLINVQQTTESVGFELPIKIVGKANTELAPVTTKTVELCPPYLADDKAAVSEKIQVTVKSNGEKEDSKLKFSLGMSFVEHIDLADKGDEHVGKFDISDQLIYRYTWTKDVTEVDVNIAYYTGDKNHKAGAGPDVCARASIRSGKCPLDEIGYSTLTFTRQGFFTVNKYDANMKDIKNGFILVLEVLSDDYACRDKPGESESKSREKTVKVTVKARKPHWPGSYLAMPFIVGLLLIVGSYVFDVLIIKPLKEPERKTYLIDVDDHITDDTKPIIEIPEMDNALPPFDQATCSDAAERCQAKQVDLEGYNSDSEIDLGGGSGPPVPSEPRLTVQSYGHTPSKIRQMFAKVKENEIVVNITQTIGHCAIPLLIFLNLFDSAYDDVTGNVKDYTLAGNLDACYVNSKCAFPANISNYRVPDVSRVTSNIPYLVSGMCFWVLATRKANVMKPITAAGNGVNHDYSLFNVLAFITGIIGFSSATYHVCPNQTTSRIDMYFIEILLAYYSLKLYQSRVPDIRSVFYAPGVTISLMNIIERIFGTSRFSWIVVCSTHIVFTLVVSIQLFFLGKITMNPVTLYENRHMFISRIKAAKNNPTFKYQAIAFSMVLASSVALVICGLFEVFGDYATYNVIAIGMDIVIYLGYYLLTKFAVRRERAMRHVVVLTVLSSVTWLLAISAYVGYKSIDTSLSPAQSRCNNKECIVGAIDGHDIWHCLSATAILLSNLMVMSVDDDLVNTKTELTYF